MDRSVIFQKTEKGQQEIASRAFKLPARERSMLILVDGRRTGQQLVDQARHFGDAEQFFRHLLEEGFIEPSAVAVRAAASKTGPATVPPRTLPPSLTAQPSPHVLAAVKKSAARFLLDTLGPDADSLAITIESARNIADLSTQLDRYSDTLRTLKGPAVAEQFRKQIRSLFEGRG